MDIEKDKQELGGQGRGEGEGGEGGRRWDGKVEESGDMMKINPFNLIFDTRGKP